MRKTETGVNFTVRNQPIRICIAQALINLLAKKPLEDITITELVKAAHVSRMTFYKYYASKQDVLSDYMYEMMNQYMQELAPKGGQRNGPAGKKTQRTACRYSQTGAGVDTNDTGGG